MDCNQTLNANILTANIEMVSNEDNLQLNEEYHFDIVICTNDIIM